MRRKEGRRIEFDRSSPAWMALLLIGLATFAGAQTITEFPIPTAVSNPFAIAAGPDGNLWFTESNANKIGRITPAGAVTEFPVGGGQTAIAAGPDGALWFTGGATGIGRITPAGAVTGFTGGGQYITTGPDGALWLTKSHSIARFSPSDPNTVVEYPTVGTVSTLGAVTTGPDGNIWFTETDHAGMTVRIARIDLTKLIGCSANPSLCITEFAVPGGVDFQYSGITSGPDGALWFTSAGRVGRITTSGIITQFNAASSTPVGGITRGADGALWYAGSGNKIGRITTSGTLTEFFVSAGFTSPRQIAAGPDGNIWFTEINANKIGRLSGIGPPPATSITVPVAASIHGVGGSFFHSDVRVFNRSNSDPVTVTAKYHCFTPPCGNSPQTFTLSPREMRVFDDMIAVAFSAPESGGAIEFSSTGSLVVTSRLYTPSRPAPTNGMGVPGIPESQALTSAVATSLSYSADLSMGFRSNVGAYNANDVPQTISFTVFDGNGSQLGKTTASAAARAAVQVNIFSAIGATTDIAHAYCVVSGDQNLPLLVYAGVIDNQSQDLAFVQGQANTRGAGADRATIPVAASIHGAGVSFFHTDATVLNTSTSASANVTLRYRCFSGSCGNSPQTATLAPREMRAFDDVIGATFAAPESGGAIQFDSDQPIVVNSRLYTPSRPAPTNGMGVPGVTEAGAPTVAVLTSLSHSANASAGFRSNVGAYNANDVPQTITFTLYDTAGGQLGQASASAPARTSVQVSNVFAVAGFTRDVPDAYCVVHGDQNLPLLVYAGVIDNQSQDLAFIKGETDQ